MAYLHITQAWDLSVHSNIFTNKNEASELFEHSFNVVPVMKPEDMEEVYKLRYQVYCIERNFENPEHYKTQQEIDPFDKRSAYILLQDQKSGEYIGTARLVLADQHNLHTPGYKHFPIQTLTDQDFVDEASLDLNKTAEISRICFSQYKAQNLGLNSDQKRLILPGLLQGIYLLRDLHDIDNFTAILENRLIKRADQLGFAPNEVGDPVHHKGTRYPVYYDCYQTMSNIRQHNKTIWDIVTAKGKYCPNGSAMTVEAMTPQWDINDRAQA
ncbi:MAG: PEP-CTERM/exosortase system-associated acyltransferase [Alphaproteobacteria bacterium]